ncbi:hypothetical protein JOY44_00435 [Phormidium sp. CLA17]|uniref:hypothetical protein n=1 Tax=Leptolyngbya sp. Cla-17 TaxID=2803751 RepID=UPI00149136EC|nr:hypothetical protein [Leptolyngbya sp. Cla-17]MBM0740123.1 hypothetical protein [Leptolyngbya sp. Cla-17]
MEWLKRTRLGLAILNTLICTIALGIESATSAPGDVVVEIKIESPIERFPKGSFHESQPPFQQPIQLPSFPKDTSTLPAQGPFSSSYPSFNSQQLDRQLQLYTHYLAQFGKPDILIVGSSRALQGVDPMALQQALAKRGYPNLKIFNFGINGATAQVVDWLLRQLLTTEQLPRLIVWADGARAFNSGRIDHTFNKIRASQGYKVGAGIRRPPSSQTSGLEVGQICMDILPLQLTPQLKSISTQPREVPLSAMNDACHQTAKVTIRSGISSSSPLMPSMTAVEALGFQVVNTQFDPKVYFQRFPKVSGYYDADYIRFTLAGRQINALERVVNFANKQQIPLVFVNLPLTQTYLDAARFAYEDQFRRGMQRFERSRRLRFKDLGLQPGLDSNRYFADPSHLNRHGAAVVAMQISADLARLTGKMQLSAKPDSVRSLSSSLVQCEKGCLYLPKIFAGFPENSLDVAIHP